MESIGTHRQVLAAIRAGRPVPTITGINVAETTAPKRTAADDWSDPLRFDGITVQYELVPDHDTGQWLLRMYDAHGHVAWIVLPRGEAHATAHLLAIRMERRQFELPRAERWVGRTPL